MSVFLSVEFCQCGKVGDEFLDAYETTMTDADKVSKGMKRPSADGE